MGWSQTNTQHRRKHNGRKIEIIVVKIEMLSYFNYSVFLSQAHRVFFFDACTFNGKKHFNDIQMSTPECFVLNENAICELEGDLTPAHSLYYTILCILYVRGLRRASAQPLRTNTVYWRSPCFAAISNFGSFKSSCTLVVIKWKRCKGQFLGVLKKSNGQLHTLVYCLDMQPEIYHAWEKTNDQRNAKHHALDSQENKRTHSQNSVTL